MPKAFRYCRLRVNAFQLDNLSRNSCIFNTVEQPPPPSGGPRLLLRLVPLRNCQSLVIASILENGWLFWGYQVSWKIIPQLHP